MIEIHASPVTNLSYYISRTSNNIIFYTYDQFDQFNVIGFGRIWQVYDKTDTIPSGEHITLFITLDQLLSNQITSFQITNIAPFWGPGVSDSMTTWEPTTISDTSVRCSVQWAIPPKWATRITHSSQSSREIVEELDCESTNWVVEYTSVDTSAAKKHAVL